MTITRRADARFYIFMVLPGMVIYMIIVVLPVLASIALGFTRFDIYQPANSAFIGLANYARIFFSDPKISGEFRSAFANNINVVLG